MPDQKTFTEIMSNPRRDECKGRFIKLANELEASGYKISDIAYGGWSGVVHIATKDIPAGSSSFFRYVGISANGMIKVALATMDRLTEERKKLH